MYLAAQKLRKLWNLKNNKMNEIFSAWNRCSKELYENKKNMFFKHQMPRLAFIPIIKCISNKQDLLSKVYSIVENNKTNFIPRSTVTFSIKL